MSSYITRAGNCATNFRRPMPSRCRSGRGCSHEPRGIEVMNRMMAIVEREMRKFFRSPALMLASMIFPLVQLIILGNAFGGKIRDARVAIVDQDGGTQALRVREAFDSVRANIRTFVPLNYDSEKQAVADVRNGKLEGAGTIPARLCRRADEENQPRVAVGMGKT